MNEVRIATRSSPLALVQAGLVADRLRDGFPGLRVPLVEVVTSGDRHQESAIAELSELGAFVRSVQREVVEGRADLAVHSLKDLPVDGPRELVLAAFPERGSPCDVLVGSTLEELGPGAVVGTGSPRRIEQLLALRPDLRTIEMRGNVGTRLDKVAAGHVDAAVLAEAALVRLGRSDLIGERFDIAQMVPAPGQGALAVETRTGSEFAEVAATIDDDWLRICLSAERLLLAETGAGCRSALGAYATREDEKIRLDVFVADDRGRRRAVAWGECPEVVVAEARKELGL